MTEAVSPAAVCARVSALFRGVLEGEPQLLVALADYEGDIWLEGGDLRFTLPALHTYLYTPAELEYPDFRRGLYASELNAELQGLGGKVVIDTNAGKVDQTLYRLTRHVP